MKPPLKIRKSYEEVFEHLRDQIVSGKYNSGERLPSIKELSILFGVGQSTIREAIGSLKTMGLVTIKQGEGTFVTHIEPTELLSRLDSLRPITKQDIISLFEVRKIVETSIAKVTAQRRTIEDLRLIGDALNEMEDAHNQNLSEMGTKADWKFHIAISRATRNEILNLMMHSISELIERTMSVSCKKMFEIEGVSEKLLQDHRDIYDAIRLQKAEEAELLMLKHLQYVENFMM